MSTKPENNPKMKKMEHSLLLFFLRLFIELFLNDYFYAQQIVFICLERSAIPRKSILDVKTLSTVLPHTYLIL